MNKKYVMAFLFISGLIVTLFLRKPTAPSHIEDGHDYTKSRMDSHDSNNSNQRDVVAAPKEEPSPRVKLRKDELEEQLDRDEAQFELVEKLWAKVMENKFEELGLSSNNLNQYQMMREEFEQDALAKFEDFHQKLQETKGENYKYRLTEFDDQVMNQLRKEYNEKLAKIIGEEAIREIVKTRDEFNEGIKRKTKHAHDDVLIDF